MVMLAVHPRTRIVNDADRELESFLLELQAKHKLTEAELMSVLARHVSNTARYAIRAERHPQDPEKAGDEA